MNNSFKPDSSDKLSYLMISTEDTFLKVKDFLRARLEIETDTLAMDSKLEDLGIDSLMQLELIFDFEEKFAFQMPDLAERPTTVGELVKVIQEHLPDATEAIEVKPSES